ncbi:MAG: GNAT family N-acetyltransferase [Paracoccaceae bacterium]
MVDGVSIRSAVPKDALVCATILNDWIDTCDWMPRVHSRDDVRAFYEGFVFVKRDVFVADDPVAGFLAIDADDNFVTALYVARPGQGTGKTLLDFAKRGRKALKLWTFQANKGARQFYLREGLEEAWRTDGDNEEKLPDVLLQWERS